MTHRGCAVRALVVAVVVGVLGPSCAPSGVRRVSSEPDAGLGGEGEEGGSAGQVTGGAVAGMTGGAGSGVAGAVAGATGGAGAGGAAGMPMAGMPMAGMPMAGMTMAGMTMAGATAGAMAGAAAGAAGMAMAGMGGMTPPPGPVAAPTSADLFTGAANTVNKIVGGDPTPGYFYGGSPSGITPTVAPVMLAAADTAAPLPSTMKYAQRMTVATGDFNVVLYGWNFRPDDGMKWRWIDASGYTGVSFWAKVSSTSGGTGTANLVLFPVAANNIATTDVRAGSCPNAQAMCPWLYRVSLAVTSTWKQFRFNWTDFMASTEMGVVPGAPDWKQLARFDLFYSAPVGMTTFDLFVTGVKLEK